MLSISAIYVTILAVFILVLAYNITKHRRVEKIGLGDGENKPLEVAIRAHGNAVEYIPICLLLLIVAELNKAPELVIHAFGIVLVLSRFLHAWGFTKTQGKTSFGRFCGILLNWLFILVMAVINIIYAF